MSKAIRLKTASPCPFQWGYEPHLIHGYSSPDESADKPAHDQFSHFCTIHRVPNTQTTLLATSSTACDAMRPDNMDVCSWLYRP